MKLMALVAVTAMTMGANAVPEPDYVGEMTITYIPIMCVVAPCPPGHYRIEANGAIIGEGDFIVIENEDQQMQYRGMYLDIETVSGLLWVGGEDRTDVDGIGIPPGMLVAQIDASAANGAD